MQPDLVPGTIPGPRGTTVNGTKHYPIVQHCACKVWPVCMGVYLCARIVLALGLWYLWLLDTQSIES